MSELKKLLKNAQEEDPILRHKFSLQFEGYSESYVKAFLETSLEYLNAGKLTHKEFQMKCFELAFMNLPRKVGVFHPSDLCQYPVPCAQKLFYQYTKTPQDEGFISFADDLNMRRLLDLGTMVHMYIQFNLRKLGILDDFEVDVKGGGIGGNADGVIQYQGKKAVLEVKTMNTFQFAKLKAPDTKHVKQASIYADKLGIDWILFIYYDKNNSNIKLFFVEKNLKYTTLLNEFLSTKVKQFKGILMRKSGKPERACTNRVTERAVECPYVNKCFEK